MRRFTLYFTFALVILAIGIVIGLYVQPSSTDNTVEAQTARITEAEISRRLRNERVEAFYRWNVGDTEDESPLCIVRSFDNDPRMKLTILNPSGTPIYEDYFESLIRVYETTALRNLSTQLVLEVVYGGTGRYHLRMLDYRNGRIVRLIDGEDGLFNAVADVRPQFRSGITPSAEPFQIMLTEGVGLASPAEKYTRVYRYRNNAYEYVGRFQQRMLDDYMERLLRESRQR